MKKEIIIILFIAIASSCANKSQLQNWLSPVPEFEVREIFKTERFPNIVTAVDGSIVTTWGSSKVVSKRSEDGGKTWSNETVIADPGFQGGGTTVDDASGNIFAFVEEGHPVAPVHIYKSEDMGQSWSENNSIIHPDLNRNSPSMHMNEHGITLQFGKFKGRLIRPSRYYGKTNDRSEWPNHYTNAIYSDDGGSTWQTSKPFPANGTGEATIAELSDGSIYYNSRRHLSTDGLNPKMRHIAKSYDGGETWEDLEVSDILPDGGQFRDYGLMAGLCRLPLKDYDILLFSNIISQTQDEGRSNGHVWISFDGGITWPVKKQVDSGSFAYSSMTAGKNGTASEGYIFLMYESNGGAKVARFNLAWLLDNKDVRDYL